MKVVTLIGSHRRNGNTARVVDLVEARLRDLAEHQAAPLEIERVYLGAQQIEPCRGCRVCFDRGEAYCPLHDDLLELKAKIQGADGILVGSPVYVDDVSGTVKTFIDRLAHVCHRPEFADTCVYLVATTGSSPTSHTLRTLQGAWLSWGAHLVGRAGFETGALTAQDEIAAHHQKKIDRVANDLLAAVRSRAYQRPSFVSLMMFKIQQLSWSQVDPNSVDYHYWHDQGWLDPKTTFFIPHQRSPLLVASARAVGSIVARFVA